MWTIVLTNIVISEIRSIQMFSSLACNYKFPSPSNLRKSDLRFTKWGAMWVTFALCRQQNHCIIKPRTTSGKYHIIIYSKHKESISKHQGGKNSSKASSATTGKIMSHFSKVQTSLSTGEKTHYWLLQNYILHLFRYLLGDCVIF